MQRYFLELSYLGTKYHGWQKQPNAVSIQGTIEPCLSKIFQKDIPIVGCGRTDTGVHARQYFAHFDTDVEADKEMVVYKMNRMLPDDIGARNLIPVQPDAHARFDAISRKYHYYIKFSKAPLQKDTVYVFPLANRCDWEKVHRVTSLLSGYDAFFPFCKSQSGVDHYEVKLHLIEWKITSESAVFQIQGNRFLRGMVRLIVGACLNVGIGQLEIQEVVKALKHQRALMKSWSVPSQGLFLENVTYDFF
jgi:tRNA pseudouridine38-40 synthase